MIYLDNAATTCPKPKAVINAVNFAMNNLCANPGRSGHTPSINAATAVFECRDKVSEFFGLGQPERVVFTQNCTHSINTVLKGLDLRNKKIVISSLEHNAVTRPVYELSQKGVEVSVAEVFFGDDDATLRSFEHAIDRNTALVFCTHASNVCGAVLPIEKIGQLCKSQEVLFAVDAAQTAGVFPIDMKRMNIDFLCAPGHKGLFAPMGTGILLCKKDLIYPLMTGGTGTRSSDPKQPNELPEFLESGTLNVSGIVGLKSGIDFVSAKGIDNIRKHETSLCSQIFERLSKTRGVKLYTPVCDGNHFAPVFSFNLENLHSTETAARLNEMGFALRSGLHCAPSAHRRIGTLESGTVRVSPGIFTTPAQVNFFCESVKKIKI